MITRHKTSSIPPSTTSPSRQSTSSFSPQTPPHSESSLWPSNSPSTKTPRPSSAARLSSPQQTHLSSRPAQTKSCPKPQTLETCTTHSSTSYRSTPRRRVLPVVEFRLNPLSQAADAGVGDVGVGGRGVEKEKHIPGSQHAD